MRIAFDAKRFFNNGSGLGNYSRDLVRILAEYFPENQYFLLNKSKSERGSDILNLPNVRYYQTPASKFSRQLQMGKQAQNLGAEIFHGLSGELPVAWNATKIKKVVTIHDLIFERYPEYYTWFDRKIHFWKFKRAAATADLIIAISEQTKQDIIHYLNIPSEKIRVVYQTCHSAFQRRPEPDFLQDIQKKFALPRKFVLSVGTVEPRKNLAGIIHALAGTDIPLVVVGKKQKKYSLKVAKLIQAKGVNVQFLEDVSMPELAAIYRLATVFVYPSFFEGFGIPVIEALFSGLPVVASHRSSMPEAGGEAALYVDPENPADIRAKILHLWNYPSECSRRAELGIRHAQKFKDKAVAESLMQVYQELLQTKNPE